MSENSIETVFDGGELIGEIRTLSKDLNNPDLAAPIIQQYTDIGNPEVHLMVWGSPNSGKSFWINKLLNRDVLPVNALPSSWEFRIHLGKNEAECWSLLNDASKGRPLDQMKTFSGGSSPNSREVSVWLKSGLEGCEAPFLIFEKNLPKLENAQAILAFQKPILDLDVLLLVVDALAPLRRDETALIRAASLLGRKIGILLTKTDELADDEKSTVVNYIHQQIGLEKDEYVFFCAEGNDLQKTASEIQNWIQSSSEPETLKRDRFQRFILSVSLLLEKIKAEVQKRKEADELLKEAAGKAMEEKMAMLESASLKWDSIQIELEEKKNRTLQMLQDDLNNVEKNIVTELRFRLEKTSDVKQWWEKDLPHDIHIFDGKFKQVENTLQENIITDMKWLCGEVNKTFGIPISVLTPGNVNKDTDYNVDLSARESLTDIGKVKTYSRVGTMMAVLAGGVMLTTMGAGFAVMGIGAVAGLLGEHYIHKKVVGDRTLILPEIQRLANECTSEFYNRAFQYIKNEYDEIFNALRNRQCEWKEKIIENENKNQPVTSSETLDWEEVQMKLQELAAKIEKCSAMGTWAL